ncbi:MAG: choice-of-anchor tandem repeat GloVer-containing protein [Burkholderiaceae bacterium]
MSIALPDVVRRCRAAVAAGLLGTIVSCLPPLTLASGVTVIHDFTGTGGTGKKPNGALVQASDGGLYGTAWAGGAKRWGDVFKLTTTGSATVVRSFKGQTGGNHPWAGLILGKDGHLYGTTFEGAGDLDGTLFKVSLNGALTVLHEFHVADSLGASPNQRLLQASNGDIYGISRDTTPCCGAAWRYRADGSIARIHAFTMAEGYEQSALVQGNDGLIYGVATVGGTFDRGTAFRMSADGSNFSVLHQFNWDNGNTSYPDSLMRAADGQFYGTAAYGGGYCGALFRMDASGNVNVLYEFPIDTYCGHPNGALIQASDGNFYGVTSHGGAADIGTLYRMTPGGTVTVMHEFSGADGSEPFGALVQAGDGRLYGTTLAGGAHGNGTAFSFQIP